jgi:Fe-S-cluster containining protein
LALPSGPGRQPVRPYGVDFPPCLRCGACCFGDNERYVPVSGDDHQRLGDFAEQLTQFLGNRCFMRMREGHCAALEIRASGEFYCGVYEQRPSVCRELARGSAACEAEFSRKRPESERAHLRILSSS